MNESLTSDERCNWTQDGEDSSVWQTSCGRYFDITDGSPADNEMAFCVYCGKRLAQHSYQPEDEDDE